MRRAASRPEDPSSDQTPLLGVLSVLMLLIPSLVMMAQVCRLTEIDVSPPLFSAEGKPDDVTCRLTGPRLHVAVAYDGFYTRIDHAPWRAVGSSRVLYDHDALTEEVREFKRVFPHETIAVVSAEPDVPFHELVATLDTVRGRDCRLAGLLAGEEFPAECLLWNPIVEAPAANAHRPADRGGPTWPPRRVVTDLDATPPGL